MPTPEQIHAADQLQAVLAGQLEDALEVTRRVADGCDSAQASVLVMAAMKTVSRELLECIAAAALVRLTR